MFILVSYPCTNRGKTIFGHFKYKFVSLLVDDTNGFQDQGLFREVLSFFLMDKAFQQTPHMDLLMNQYRLTGLSISRYFMECRLGVVAMRRLIRP